MSEQFLVNIILDITCSLPYTAELAYKAWER